MTVLDLVLLANNSSGEQQLSLTADGDDYWFTLFGKYHGSLIQIDFDELSREQLEDIKAGIELILDE